MASISVVISAFNEEKKIRDCLESAKWVDEIIFIDNSSTDKTAQIAKKYTNKIFTCPNKPMLNVNKNFGFTKTTGDWVLSLDADERITPKLRDEIKELIIHNSSLVAGFWIPRKNIIFGKWIRSDMWWPDYQLRLFRKGRGRFPEQHVHEYIKIDGQTQKLKEPMLHQNYETVSQFLYKMDQIYTESEVKQILEKGKALDWFDAIRMPANDFFKTFFAQKGYRDGLHGLILSILQAMYMETVFIKVWERQGFKEQELNLHLVKGEFKKISRQARYWFLTTLIEETHNSFKKVLLRVKRKLL